MGDFISSQDANRVKSDVVLCSCERSSSSRCPGFAQAVAWMADDQIPVSTTQVHLGQKENTSLKTNTPSTLQHP